MRTYLLPQLALVTAVPLRSIRCRNLAGSGAAESGRPGSSPSCVSLDVPFSASDMGTENQPQRVVEERMKTRAALPAEQAPSKADQGGGC